jgi:hypothetical protein
MKNLRNKIHKLTLALTVFGVILSTLHQSSLGALYIAVPSKMHPLWYSPYLAILFFVSSIPPACPWSSSRAPWPTSPGTT